jgi:hypothetical protein
MNREKLCSLTQHPGIFPYRDSQRPIKPDQGSTAIPAGLRYARSSCRSFIKLNHGFLSSLPVDEFRSGGAGREFSCIGNFTAQSRLIKADQGSFPPSRPSRSSC